jgi:hypothetical protein
MLFGAVVGPANPVVVVNTSGDGIWFAVLGFVGVLVGAFASGGFNLLVARRRERADAQVEAIRHRVEVRRAARLIDDDIRVAADAVKYALDHKQWWPSPQRLTSVGWQEYRHVLAPDLSDLDWRQVSMAVTVIDRLQWVSDEAAKAIGRRASSTRTRQSGSHSPPPTT